MEYTTETFVKKAQEIHKDEFGNPLYDYSKFVYVNSKSKGIIICSIHGEFEQRPTNHIKGQGCRKCGYNKISTPLNDFIKKAQEVHNDRGNLYDYSKVVYVNSRTKVIITCLAHGDFSQMPRSHIRGHGCKKCDSSSRKSNFDIFAKKSQEIHKDECGNPLYDYSNFFYTNRKTKSSIKCFLGHIFFQTPSDHFGGNGCPDCFKIRNTGNLDDFIEKSKQIHTYGCSSLYEYHKVKYTNNNTKVIIICKKHGPFKQRPTSHTRGHGCPKCTSSVSKIEQKWLTSIGVGNEYHHKTIYINNKRYFVDAYDPRTNTIYEFHGDYWHGNLNKYNPDKIHSHRKIPFRNVREESDQREQEIRNAGYNLVTMWESDFKRLLKQK